MLGLVVAVFYLAKRLFDAQVAWVSALLLLGTELFWRFSVSGLSTILLVLVFTGLVWCLVLLEEEIREPKWKKAGIFFLAALVGALVGLGGLTRYSFCWLIVPVILFILFYAGPRRSLLGILAFLGFAVVLAPWVVRNYSLSGMPFGTATFAIIENSWIYPEDRLERTINPVLLKSIHNTFPFLTVAAHIFWQKLVANCRSNRPNGSAQIGRHLGFGILPGGTAGSVPKSQTWPTATISAGFARGPVGSPGVGPHQVIRRFARINTENLLVVAAPLVVMYGVSLFFVVLEQVELPFFQLRSAAVGLFCAIASLPLILTILPPKTVPIVYPPYYPPSIQTAVGWTKEDELMMSDIPWAVAWYGQSQCVWLTLNARVEFFAINDLLPAGQRAVLTPQTVDRWTQSGDWGNLFLETMRESPGDNSRYPLHLNLLLPQRDALPPHYFSAELFCSAWLAWRATSS